VFEDLTITDTDAGLNFELKLDPDKRVYCFIGDNGVGKTVLLESLGQLCWYEHEMWGGEDINKAGKSFQGHYQSLELKKVLDPFDLRVPNAKNGRRSIKAEDWQFAPLFPYEEELWAHPLPIRKPIVFVSAHHRTNIANIDPGRLGLIGNTEQVFSEAVARSLRAVVRRPLDAATVATWITARLMLNPAFFYGMRRADHDVIDLCRLLQKFDEIAFLGLLTKLENRLQIGIIFKDGKLVFRGRPIEVLAHGWIALIKILQEIIATLSAWEQMRGSTDILNSDALIFIDEVDAHLHPRWQVKLIPFLKEAFPRATFFLTTHSPLLVRDTEEGEVYELVKTDNLVKSRKIGNPRDWFLADVYSQAFHVNLPPPGSEGSPSLESLMMD